MEGDPGVAAAERAAVAARLRRFAAREAPRLSPFYAALAGHAAELPEAAEILLRRRPGQPPANMLLGAVHLLLQQGAEHPLRAFFPDLTEAPRPAVEAGPVLADFLRSHRAALTAIVAARVTCTNEPRRSAALRLGAEWILHRGPGEARRVHLVEIGCSAGLNLLFDRHRIELGRHGRRGPAKAPCRLAVPVAGLLGPAPRRMPPIGRRLGIDMERTDVRDPGDRAWLQALVWPDQPARAAALAAALDAARAAPAEIRIGDAVRLLGPVLRGLPGREPAWVTHSVMLYQLSVPQRRAVARALAAASRRRPVWEIGYEAEARLDQVLRVTHYTRGRRRFSRRLATGDGHVSRLTWLPRGSDQKTHK